MLRNSEGGPAAARQGDSGNSGEPGVAFSRYGSDQALAATLIIVATFAAYWNSFAGAFQFDDYNVIVDNPAVADFAAWWQSMPGIRPLLKLSYAANNQLGGLLGFHLVNFALHAGNALMIFALARKLLGDPPAAPGVALLAALLFAVHPVHSEAVTMISGRSMSLMTSFYLASILLHLAGKRWLSLFAFAAALGVRETAITLPLALLLIDRQCAVWRAGNGVAAEQVPAPNLAKLLRKSRAHWLLAALAAGALLLLPSFRALAAVSLETRSVADNLITQSAALPYLLGQWLWPLALNADPVLPVFSQWSAFWIGSVLLCLAVGGCGFVAWWRAPLGSGAGCFGFAVVWFAVHLAPSNSFLPRLDVANERHLYVAGAGLAIAVALALTSAFAGVAARLAPTGQSSPLAGAAVGRPFGRPFGRLLGRRLGVALATLLVGALVVLTQQRNEVYRTEVGFWRDVAHKNPSSARAHNNLGYALAKSGDAAAALAAYDEAISLQPDDYKPRLNRRALCRTAAAQLPAASCSRRAEPVE